MRKLGIPTVMDRVIQQGIVQVISPLYEPPFLELSYGFRPDRGCEMAIISWLRSRECLGRAVSKDTLAKAGLVSCLSYYTELHALKLC